MRGPPGRMHGGLRCALKSSGRRTLVRWAPGADWRASPALKSSGRRTLVRWAPGADWRASPANPPYVFSWSIMLLLLAFGVQSHAAEQQHLATVQSPDKNIQYIFYQTTAATGERQLYYRVNYKHKPVILDSL